MRRFAFSLCLGIALFCAYLSLSFAKKSESPISCDRLSFTTLPLPVLRILTLGHVALLQDYSYFFLLSHLVPDVANPVRPEKYCMETQIRDMLRLRPPMESIYVLSCFTMAMDYKSPELCREILHTAIEIFPKSWRLPFTQGFIYAFRMNDKEKAAPYYQLAATMPGAPSFLPSLVGKLSSDPSLTEKDQEYLLELILRGGRHDRSPRSEP